MAAIPASRRVNLLARVAVTLGVIAGPLSAAAQQSPWSCPDPPSLVGGLEGELVHVRYLADDLLEGRAVATRGERCAGDYIAARFRALGLRPAGDGDSYFQAWMVRTGSAAGDGNVFAVAGDDATDFTLGDDWRPYGFSASVRIEALMTMVPAEADAQLADFAHGEVAGRALVIEGAAPHPHAAAPDAHRVASSAAGMGAAALIVLLGESDPLPPLDAERRASLAIPVIAVRSDAADLVRAAAASGAMATASTAVEPVRREARNVAAVLPGSDSRDHQLLVIGAHYDHLGLGGAGSLSPNAVGEVHNGADDNASGTAVLLEAARQLATGPPLAQDVLFVAFTGEERGLWGSAHYVESPLLPLEGTVAMLNLDMVGRVSDDLLTVFGTGTAEEWTDILERANDRTGAPLDLRFNSDGFGASDHSSFLCAGDSGPPLLLQHPRRVSPGGGRLGAGQRGRDGAGDGSRCGGGARGGPRCGSGFSYARRRRRESVRRPGPRRRKPGAERLPGAARHDPRLLA